MILTPRQVRALAWIALVAMIAGPILFAMSGVR